MLPQTHISSKDGLASFVIASPEYELAPVGIGSFREQADRLAEFGRNGDVYVVHAAEGETVIPMEVLEANPQVRELLFNQMRDMGLDPNEYVVGSNLNSINPYTGMPEFFFKSIFKAIKKVIKVAAPIIIPMVVGTFAGPWGAMLASAALTKLQGGSWGDVLKGAALSYAGGALMKGIGASLSGTSLGTSLGFTTALGEPTTFMEGLRSGLAAPFSASAFQKLNPSGWASRGREALGQLGAAGKVATDYVTGPGEAAAVAPSSVNMGGMESGVGLGQAYPGSAQYGDISNLTKEVNFESPPTDMEKAIAQNLPMDEQGNRYLGNKIVARPRVTAYGQPEIPASWQPSSPAIESSFGRGELAKLDVSGMESGPGPGQTYPGYMSGTELAPGPGQAYPGSPLYRDVNYAPSKPSFWERQFGETGRQIDEGLTDVGDVMLRAGASEEDLIKRGNKAAQAAKIAETKILGELAESEMGKKQIIEAMNVARASAGPSMVARYGPSLALAGGAAYGLGAFDAERPEGVTDEEWARIRADAANPIYNPAQEEDESDEAYAKRLEEAQAPYRVAGLDPYRYQLPPVLPPAGYGAASFASGRRHTPFQGLFNRARTQFAAHGGAVQYPPREMLVEGSGTERSDDIPAMLSDGEFVLNARSVRGADPTGQGDRYRGARNLYDMMRNFEMRA